MFEDTAIENHQTIEYFVQHEQQGVYITLPFTIPPDTEAFHLTYQYDRFSTGRSSTGTVRFTSRQESSIIDLGLIAPDGTQVGVSGSDKSEITISETYATPGYQPRALVPGEWRILLGAYKVAPGGVMVRYSLSFTPKRLRLLKGDLHTHTLASDGVLTAEELATLALRNGLDFLAVTDHNQMSTRESLPRIPGMTLIPGIEWTHFKGHALFLGVDQPYDEPFFSNDMDGVKARFTTARQRGATITINHPFEEACPFQFDMTALPFDCLEIWNGPMRESNLRALGLWQQMLASGKKVPLCGGSDYHREHIFIPLGGPTMCVYARSQGPSDILEAIRQGHAYLTFAPGGPSLEMVAVDGDEVQGNKAATPMMGDSVPYPQYRALRLNIGGLLKGDVIQVVTAAERTTLLQAEAPGEFETTCPVEKPGFARVEVLRGFLPGLPLLPALISNPLYFD